MSGLIIIDVDTQKNVQYVIKCIFKSKKKCRIITMDLLLCVSRNFHTMGEALCMGVLASTHK